MAARKAKGSKSSTAKSSGKAKSSGSRTSSAKASAANPSPAPNMEERMEGLQGWMAEIEKKQERTSRFGGIAVLLAILAAGGALALGIINKQDAATQDDIDELTSKVNELGASLEGQTESQLKTINERLAALEQKITGINTRQREAEAEIADLQTEIDNVSATSGAAGNDSGGGSGGGGDGGGGQGANP